MLVSAINLDTSISLSLFQIGFFLHFSRRETDEQINSKEKTILDLCCVENVAYIRRKGILLTVAFMHLAFPKIHKSSDSNDYSMRKRKPNQNVERTKHAKCKIKSKPKRKLHIYSALHFVFLARKLHALCFVIVTIKSSSPCALTYTSPNIQTHVDDIDFSVICLWFF